MHNKINLKSNFYQKTTTPFNDNMTINIDSKTTINFGYIANHYLYILKQKEIIFLQ